MRFDRCVALSGGFLTCILAIVLAFLPPPHGSSLWGQTIPGFRPVDPPHVDAGHTALIVEPPAALGPRLSRIASLLVDQCVGCHNDQQSEGGYSMSSAEAMWRAGDSKRPPIAIHPEASPDQAWGELYRRLVSVDPEERMPKDAPPLDPESIDAVYDWLAYGARVDAARDAPIESMVRTPIELEPSWPSYPRPHPVTALAFGPGLALSPEVNNVSNGSRILFSSGAKEVLAWSIAGRLLARIPVRGRYISDLEWNQVQQSLYIASGSPGQIGMIESVPWSPETARAEEGSRLLHWVARDVPLDIALSPDGGRLAIGLHDGTILVQSASSTEVLWQSATHAAAVTSLDWSADGQQLLSSSRDRTAKALHGASGDVITSFVDHERTVASLRSLFVGCVTMDEAGVLRVYPGGTATHHAASRAGFAQRTPKMVSDRERVLVPVEGGILRFRVETKQVDFKDKEGNDKKKTEWRIAEEERLRYNGNASEGTEPEIPLALAVSQPNSSHPGDRALEASWVAAGMPDGRIWIWRGDTLQPTSIFNQVHSEPKEP